MLPVYEHQHISPEEVANHKRIENEYNAKLNDPNHSCIKCGAAGIKGSFRCSKCGMLNTCCARCGIYLGRASRKNADYVLNGDKTYLICLNDNCKKEGDIPLWV